MELKELLELSHQSYKDNGFWDDYDQIKDIMKSNSNIFSKEQVEQVKYAFISQKLSLIQKEISDSLNSLRIGKNYKGGKENLDKLYDLFKNPLQESSDPYMYFRGAYMTHVKDTFEDEIATAFIKLCDLCEKIDLDVEKFIKLKLQFNKTRNMNYHYTKDVVVSGSFNPSFLTFHRQDAS